MARNAVASIFVHRLAALSCESSSFDLDGPHPPSGSKKNGRADMACQAPDSFFTAPGTFFFFFSRVPYARAIMELDFVDVNFDLARPIVSSSAINDAKLHPRFRGLANPFCAREISLMRLDLLAEKFHLAACA